MHLAAIMLIATVLASPHGLPPAYAQGNISAPGGELVPRQAAYAMGPGSITPVEESVGPAGGAAYVLQPQAVSLGPGARLTLRGVAGGSTEGSLPVIDTALLVQHISLAEGEV
jgi:hypothetical protein